MNRALKRTLAVGGVAALAVAGTGAALAATMSHTGRSSTFSAQSGPSFVSAQRGAGAFFRHGPIGARGHGDVLAAAASYLGLTAGQLQTQLQSGKTLAQIANATSGKSAAGVVAALVAAGQKELAAEVSTGRLTQARADSISASMEQRVTDLVNGVRGPGGFGHRGPCDDLSAAATYLGLTPAQLQTQLQSGKTLAQVANATAGKSADGLVGALVAAEKKELAAAVAAGRLTQAQADAMSASLTQRFTNLVNGTFTQHGPDRPGGWPGAGALSEPPASAGTNA